MHSRFGPLYLVLTLLTGCGSHGTGEHSELPIVSSTATADQNGNVQIRPATSSELSELGTTEGKIASRRSALSPPRNPQGSGSAEGGAHAHASNSGGCRRQEILSRRHNLFSYWAQSTYPGE